MAARHARAGTLFKARGPTPALWPPALAGPYIRRHTGTISPVSVIDAAALGVPETFNAATHFVDRHVREGRGTDVAIECGDERVT